MTRPSAPARWIERSVHRQLGGDGLTREATRPWARTYGLAAVPAPMADQIAGPPIVIP
jgi:hypothetical protein